MAPKRPVEVLVLDSDDEEPSLRTSRPRAGSLAAPSTAATDGIGGAADIEDQFKRDLAEATRLSLEQSRAPSTTAASGSTSAGAPAGTTAPVPAVPNAGSSRAELERARLERQRAREANGTAQPSVISASIASRATGRSPTPRKRVATLADLPTDEGSSRAGSAQNGPSPLASSSKTSQRFWDGAVKRVPNDYVPDDESFSFADLVGPRQSLETAVVSAFCLDPLWVAAHFPEETPLLLVMPRTTGDTFPDFAPIGVKRNTFRVVPPTRLEQGAGVMHTKLMLYIHHDFLRIVIPTANAVSYDWAIIDNAFYVHDFPLLAEHARSAATGGEELSGLDPLKDNSTHTQFSRPFLQVCIKLGVRPLFVSRAALYDFARSEKVRLVHSMQGLYQRTDFNKGGGLAALAKAVDGLGFAAGGHWEIEATGSSIGLYSSNWLGQMLGAASGIHPSTYFGAGKGNQVPAQLPASLPGQASRLPIKIVFPTENEILSGRGGANDGGTLFCPVRYWETKTFPRHMFHRGESKRDKVPAHTKIILGLHKYASGTPAAHEGWMYLGSHNFTPAAWGRLQNSSNGPELKITNYELGVVLPIRAQSAEEWQTKADALVTYRRPLVKYDSADRPWQQERFLN